MSAPDPAATWPDFRDRLVFLDRRELYARAAAAIYGPRWKMPLADALGMHHRTVRGWFELEPRSVPSAEWARKVDEHLLGEVQARAAECSEILAGWAERAARKPPEEPWLRANAYGELPGGICCQRATGKYCYEHDPTNYPRRGFIRGQQGEKL